MGVETRAQLTAGEAKLKAVSEEDPVGSRLTKMEELIEEQNQEIDRKFSEMLEAIRSNRFEKVLDDPVAELKQLKETNGIVEYHKKFELLSTRVNLTEDYLVRVYLDGLQIDTQVNVQMFQPQTIRQCFLIGKFYEYAHPRSNIDNVGILPLKRDSELKAKEDKEEEKIEVEMESIGLEDNLVHGAILEEESTPQFQVSIANSEILKNVELMEVKQVVQNREYVVMHENLEQEWVQKNIDQIFEVEGDVERSLEVLSIEKICYAHQVFGKMSKHEEKLGIKKKRKGFKSWMFKYKRGLRKLHALTFFKSMRMVFSQQLGMVETYSDLLMWNGKNSLPRTAIGSHVTMAFVFKQTSLSYSPCIEHNLLDTMLLRCHSKKKQRKCQKSWMFKYKFDEEDPWNLQSRTGYSLSRREIQPFISQYMWTQEVSAAIRFLLRRHLYLNFDCEELALAGRKKRKHGLPMELQSKQKKRKCPTSWQLLIGSNSCVSTLGKRKLGKDWWFKYKTAAMAKDLRMMKLSQAWRFKSARLFFYPNNEAYELQGLELWFQWKRLHGSYSMN